MRQEQASAVPPSLLARACSSILSYSAPALFSPETLGLASDPSYLSAFPSEGEESAPPPLRRHPKIQHGRIRTWILAVAILALAGVLTASLHAQGCAQCLDSTRATPPAVQAAYRHAIYLLGGVAVTLFVGGSLLLRNRR